MGNLLVPEVFLQEDLSGPMNETPATVMEMVVDHCGLYTSLGIQSSTSTLKIAPVGFVSETITYLMLVALQLTERSEVGRWLPCLGCPG